MILSRRAGLKLIAASPLVLSPGRLFAGKSSEFWNKEDPSQWSSDEIQQLVTASPWAKQVTAEVGAYSASSQASGRSSGGGRRGGGGGRMGRTGGNSSPSAGSPKFQGVVRWVSAKPILLALKLRLASDLAGHYVIGVSGLPVIAGHGEEAGNADSYDALKEATSLRAKGQDPLQPGIIKQQPDDTSTVLFGFLTQLLDLSKAKTITFTTSMGPLSVKAKFDLAHMTYKGDLAV